MLDADAKDGTSVEITKYPDGPSGERAWFYLVKNGGHTWPGRPLYLPENIIGKASQDFSATDMIWQFFQAARRESWTAANERHGLRSSKNVVYDLTMHIGQAEIAAAVTVRQPRRGRNLADAESWRADRVHARGFRPLQCLVHRWRRKPMPPFTPPPASHIEKPLL